jgi:hypothetical protein
MYSQNNYAMLVQPLGTNEKLTTIEFTDLI